MRDARRNPNLVRLALILALILALAGPVLAFAAGFAVRVGLIDWRLGYEQLILVWGWRAAWVGIAGAALAAVAAAPDLRRRWLAALVAILAAGATLGAHMAHRQALAAHPPVHEAASDWDEPLTFSGLIRDQRRASGAAPLAGAQARTCPEAAPVPRQVHPQEAARALQEAGFTVVGTAPFRVEGVRQTFWLGFSQDVVLRIRPGRTDVRVSGREARTDAGLACRLAGRVVQALSAEGA